MTDNTQLLLDWYYYAAKAPGFIGAALKQHRDLTSLTEQRQRASLGIEDSKYDHFWLRLQAMLLPRQALFAIDLQRIVEHISHDIDTPIDLEILGLFIHAGFPEHH